MNKMVVFFLALLCLLALPVLADAPKPPNLEDPKYSNCTDTSECVALNPPCGNLRAFNRANADQVAAWYDFVRPTFRCETEPANLSNSAMCSSAGKCVMVRPGPGVPEKTDPGYCDLPENCVVISGQCGRTAAVNQVHAQMTQAKMGMAGNNAQCSFVDARTPSNLRCEDHLCKIDLLNDYQQQQPPADDTANPAEPDNTNAGEAGNTPPVE